MNLLMVVKERVYLVKRAWFIPLAHGRHVLYVLLMLTYIANIACINEGTASAVRSAYCRKHVMVVVVHCIGVRCRQVMSTNDRPVCEDHRPLPFMCYPNRSAGPPHGGICTLLRHTFHRGCTQLN